MRVPDNILLVDIEAILVQIWQDMLGIESIEKTDNFFELGGHSLLAMKGITRIREKFCIEISYKDFMTSPTIATQGEIIKSRIKSKNDILRINEKITISTNDYKNVSKREKQNGLLQPNLKLPDGDVLPLDTDQSENLSKLPLTTSQKRLWYLCKLNSGSPAYNIPITIKLTGQLDVNILNETIRLIFTRHKIVFATFYSIDGEPYLSIHQNQHIKIPYDNLEHLLGEDLENKCNEIICSDTRLAFNIEKGPLFRMQLLKISRSEWLFHLTIHHLVFDGISWGLFFHEFNHIYGRLMSAENIDLESINYHQYDYAKWQENNHFNNKSDGVAYWKEYLNGIPDYTNFPFDRSRKAIPSGKGARLPIKISSVPAKKIRNYSIKKNTTVFVSMLSAYALLIKRFSGENDFCIGTPIADRPHGFLEKIFGLFVDTFPLRIKFDNIDTFEELVEFVNLLMFNVFENKNIDFDEIVEINNPQRNIFYNSIFQIAFVWPNELSATINTEKLTGERFHIKEGVTPFDLTFYMWENGEEIEGEIEYNTDLFNESTIISLRESFIKLIESIVANFEQNINDLNIISEHQFHHLKAFNNTKTPYPQESVPLLFKKVCTKFPQKAALVHNGQQVSYSVLEKRSNQLALELIQNGVKEGKPIGVFMEKSNELIISIIAILKMKCHYLPLDPEYPNHRIIDAIEDANCQYIITTKALENVISGSFKTIIINEKIWKNKVIELTAFSSPEDVAYIMYTSGTTGKPKGSLIKHKSIVRLVRNTNYIEINKNDHILSTGSIGFDATTFEFWGALLNGGTLIIVNKEVILDPLKLEEEINKNHITILWLTSSLFTQISELHISVFANLRYLLVGGDVLSVEHVNNIRRHFPDLIVINGYGPTENTTFSTCHIINEEYKDNIPIGKPISNSTAYVFNEHLQLQPPGAFGELYVGGDGLSAGYLNRPELNEEKFVLNPLDHSERLYKTGDKVRWLTDGLLEFHGRIDRQLKIRGFRVEPQEIEVVMNRIPGIIETVIKPFERIKGNPALYAFINVKENSTLTRETIISYLNKLLPAYMIPAKYDFRFGFPKTVNGKIDREKLKIKSEILESTEDFKVSSMNGIEHSVFKIFSDALNHKNFSVESNFFEIGGNSLLSVKVISNIEKSFAISLKVRDFVADLNSVRKISAYISGFKEENMQYNLKFQQLHGTFDHLFCVQSNGDGIPIFGIYCDQLFTEKVSFRNRSIYDFIWPGSDGKPISYNSVEEVAQKYLEEMQRINPHGPYYLLGFSFGGLVAYDIAIRLQKSGYQVPILMLIDSVHPRLWGSPNMGKVFINKIKKHGIIKALTVRLFNAVKQQTNDLLKKIEIYVYFKLNKKLSVRTRQFMISNEVIKLGLKYCPEFFNGGINIFKSTINPIEDKNLGWKSNVSIINLFELEGHHMEAMSKANNRSLIIRKLEALIKEAEDKF